MKMPQNLRHEVSISGLVDGLFFALTYSVSFFLDSSSRRCKKGVQREIKGSDNMVLQHIETVRILPIFSNPIAILQSRTILQLPYFLFSSSHDPRLPLLKPSCNPPTMVDFRGTEAERVFRTNGVPSKTWFQNEIALK